MIDEGALARLIEPGSTVALADGIGAPVATLRPLADAAAAAGGVRLFLGWMPGRTDDLAVDAFTDVRTVMAGYGLRNLVDEGKVQYVPTRLSAVPALLSDVIRPRVLLASVVQGVDGWHLPTEASWLRSAVRAGARIAAVIRPTLPCADAGPPLPDEQVVVIGEDPAPAAAVSFAEPADVHRDIGARVTSLIPSEARLQYGPGAIGTAVLDALTHPVAIDTGMLTDAVVDLDRRGQVIDTPVAPYLAGRRIQEWAHQRRVLHPVEMTHDPIRLASGRPFVAVNTALEIDLDGQVNVEAVGGSAIAGIGGHPDYAAAAARCPRGLSIVALPTEVNGRSTLVEANAAPVSTPAHDIDVIVTEHGCTDLRGRSRSERRTAIASLWGVA